MLTVYTLFTVVAFSGYFISLLLHRFYFLHYAYKKRYHTLKIVCIDKTGYVIRMSYSAGILTCLFAFVYVCVCLSVCSPFCAVRFLFTTLPKINRILWMPLTCTFLLEYSLIPEVL